MTDIGKPERKTQNRVVKLFRDELGYRYLCSAVSLRVDVRAFLVEMRAI